MYNISRLSATELGPVREEIIHVYREAFSLPPYDRNEVDVRGFAHSLARHTQRKEFRCCVATEHSNGRVLGFVYGYTSEPGQWWHDTVVRALDPTTVQQWLSGAFEFVELAVLPSAQGQGIGGKLHDTILEGLPHRTAALSTYQTETTALQLYRKRGWIPLLQNFFFPNNNHPFLIMGLNLRTRKTVP